MWHSKPPRTCHLPLRPIRGLLRLLEGPLLPLLPLTAGQLATFANDGTVRGSAFLESRWPGMKRLADILEAAAHG